MSLLALLYPHLPVIPGSGGGGSGTTINSLRMGGVAVLMGGREVTFGPPVTG
jgi:hypothetical protein